MAYSQLLPGITNVTERARYFSFYTWIAWSFDHRLKTLDSTEYVAYYRRADCLYTLIAAQEAKELGRLRPAERMIGRLKLLPALERLQVEGRLRLSEYATQEDNGRRYFKNTMGGLGQYYAGPLMKLGLCKRASSGPWIKYSTSSGVAIAESIEKALPTTAFWDAVTQDVITVETLTALRDFAPNRIALGSPEHQQLLDIFLERLDVPIPTEDGVASAFGAERRRTLGLILHLSQAISAGDSSVSEWSFRPCVYSRTLPGAKAWSVPSVFEETQVLWSLYERNDLLSIACQTILSACLVALETEAGVGQYYDSVETFARHIVVTPVMENEWNTLAASTFGALVHNVNLSGPTIAQFEDPKHEFQLELQMLEDWHQRPGFPESFIGRALYLLATLTAREGSFPAGYGALAIESADLSGYPINLVSFRKRTSRWLPMSLASVASDLISWVLNTHLSVALRKLSYTRTSSFHLRPTERGLQVVGEIPPPARTLPRLTQAIRILEDLGMLQEVGSDYLVKITPLGEQLLGEILA
jgi:hypothetical protein